LRNTGADRTETKDSNSDFFHFQILLIAKICAYDTMIYLLRQIALSTIIRSTHI
jgi:hypothetical protein